MPKVRIMAVRRLCLLVGLVLLAPAALIVQGVAVPGVAQAQSGPVREIRVVGNRRVEPETVRSYLQFSTGDNYDADKVDRSLRALFATGLFADVRIDREGNAAVITVVENPVINQVAFEGNSEVDRAALEAEVQLKPRSVFTRAKVQADVQRILDVYRRQGRFAASVEPKIIELDSNRVNLVFEINEGQATKVKAINFINNKAFTDSQLRDIITTTQSGLFDFLKGTNIYDPDRLALDRDGAIIRLKGVAHPWSAQPPRVPAGLREALFQVLDQGATIPSKGLLIGPVALDSGVALLWASARRPSPSWEEMSERVHEELRRRFLEELMPIDSVVLAGDKR